MLEFFIPVESFFDHVQTAKIWPESLTNNKDFMRQIEQRRKSDKQLNDILNSLPRPDIHLETAINQGHITEKQAAELYTSFNDLLSDDEYKRITLYLPFEFLPNKTWLASGKELRQAIERFRQTYLKTWKRLLSVKDVRANFADGDVLEIDSRVVDLPRVVKAAHLIPKLVEEGLIEVKDVLTLLEESNDRILKDSITDALSFMGILKPRPETAVTPTAKHITKNREIWLKKMERQKIIEASAESLSTTIIEGKQINEKVPVVLIEAIRRAVETAVSTDYGKASGLYARHGEVLLKLWSKDNGTDAKEALLKTFRRLNLLKIIDDKKMAELHIIKPKLAGPFSENLRLIQEEINDISNMAASIKQNHELSRLIYPVVIIYGSHLNGYGEQNADIDLAVLVKPETAFTNRPRLKELLKKTFSHKKIKTDEIVEFWLEKNENYLKVREFAGTESDLSFGKACWTFILFSAAWLGSEDAMRDICGKLLVPYMYDSNARSIYIEDLEHSTLLYRLMHKGYERFFPRCGGIDINAPYANGLDAKSMFWDSGYRQVAAKLFVSRIFLPKIS